MKKLGFLLLLLPFVATAQEKKEVAKRWSSIGSLGLVVGESGGHPAFQLSSGYNFHQFFTGIGLGYDHYLFRSIPVFADLRYKFGRKKVGFVYGAAGYNFPLHYKESEEWAKTGESYKGGLYVDAGIGCRWPVGKIHRLLLSTGFTQKSIRQQKTFVFPCFTGNCHETRYDQHYSLGRLTAKLSWEIGY